MRGGFTNAEKRRTKILILFIWYHLLSHPDTTEIAHRFAMYEGTAAGAVTAFRLAVRLDCGPVRRHARVSNAMANVVSTLRILEAVSERQPVGVSDLAHLGNAAGSPRGPDNHRFQYTLRLLALACGSKQSTLCWQDV